MFRWSFGPSRRVMYASFCKICGVAGVVLVRGSLLQGLGCRDSKFDIFGCAWDAYRFFISPLFLDP